MARFSHGSTISFLQQKRRIFWLHDAAFVVPPRPFYSPCTKHEEFVGSFTKRYKDWLHVIASVNLCKLTSPPHTPFHNLFSLYINTMESCCLCLEKQKRMVRKPEPLSRRHSSPPIIIRWVVDKIAMESHSTLKYRIFKNYINWKYLFISHFLYLVRKNYTHVLPSYFFSTTSWD